MAHNFENVGKNFSSPPKKNRYYLMVLKIKVLSSLRCLKRMLGIRVKLLTANVRIVCTKNPRNHRDIISPFMLRTQNYCGYNLLIGSRST